MITLKPSIIAALVARCGHGQVILTREELFDAELMTIETSVNDRGELILQTKPNARSGVNKGRDSQ